jgi:hypothetical protein
MPLTTITSDDALATSGSPLLNAARIKLQLLLELAEGHASVEGDEAYPSLPVVQDYNQLLGLARKAAPALKQALPADIITPYDRAYQSATWNSRSVWEWFFPSPGSDAKKDHNSARLLSYRELSTLCRQIERFLK